MGKLIATRGLPGCGKSSWAKEEVLNHHTGTAVRINKDLIRTMLHFDKWSPENETLTSHSHSLIIGMMMVKEIPLIICDDTNLSPKVMESLKLLAGANLYQFEIKDFTDVPLDVCIDRDAKREGYARVGSKVILDMHNRYLNYARKTDV